MVLDLELERAGLLERAERARLELEALLPVRVEVLLGDMALVLLRAPAQLDVRVGQPVAVGGLETDAAVERHGEATERLVAASLARPGEGEVHLALRGVLDDRPRLELLLLGAVLAAAARRGRLLLVLHQPLDLGRVRALRLVLLRLALVLRERRVLADRREVVAKLRLEVLPRRRVQRGMLEPLDLVDEAIVLVAAVAQLRAAQLRAERAGGVVAGGLRARERVLHERQREDQKGEGEQRLAHARKVEDLPEDVVRRVVLPDHDTADGDAEHEHRRDDVPRGEVEEEAARALLVVDPPRRLARLGVEQPPEAAPPRLRVDVGVEVEMLTPPLRAGLVQPPPHGAPRHVLPRARLGVVVHARVGALRPHRLERHSLFGPAVRAPRREQQEGHPDAADP